MNSHVTRRSVLISGAAAFALSAGTIPQAHAQQVKKGGTLQFAISAETPHYDNHGSDTYATLHFAAPFYSTLLRFNLDKFPDVQGDLAEKWEVAPDLMTYTFKLTPGVKFHDGSDLTSADVKATYDRLRNTAGRRGLDAQGDLQRHRHDRDAGRDHRHLQDEGGERLDARTLRLAVERDLLGEGSRRRSERTEGQGQRHRAVHVRRARERLVRRGQEERQLLQEGPAASRRLQGHLHPAGRRDAQRAAGRDRCSPNTAASRRPSATASCRRWATGSASRSRAGRSTCSSASTSRRSRSMTFACARRC